MSIKIQQLGRVNYPDTWQAMKDFTEIRQDSTPDEIWVCEHTPVFTLGLAGDPSHLLQPSDIPLFKSDRGGQITYHGPGQLVVYPLLNLKRYGLRVREYVQLLEQVIIECLIDLGLDDAQRKPDAPGVYLGWNASDRRRQAIPAGQLAKIAALGIKIRKGCTYHGLSLNVKMDLTPFTWINPCGYSGLETIDLYSVGVKISFDEMQLHIVKNLISKLELLQTSHTESSQ